jgi:hypothetical protein
MISDFTRPPLANLAGLQFFTYTPFQYVQQQARISRSLAIAPLIFYSGWRLFNGYSTIDTLDFNEKAIPTENGQSYEWTITGFIPGDSDTLVSTIEEMERNRHLVCVKDRMGIKRLVGIGAPLVFTTIFNDGAKAGDTRGYTFTFTNTGKYRAPVYNL